MNWGLSVATWDIIAILNPMNSYSDTKVLLFVINIMNEYNTYLVNCDLVIVNRSPT